MALVAYDYSDGSDVEEDENETVVSLNQEDPMKSGLSLPAPKQTAGIIDVSKKQQNNAVELHETGIKSDQSLFNLLPQPSKKRPEVIEADDEFLHKKETVSAVKPKAKITVPSLNDFRDVEDIPNKPKFVNMKKSGLLSMLPKPRNNVSIATTTKSFVPHILTQKSNKPASAKPLPTPVKHEKKEAISNKEYSDESDNDDEVQNDFFSMNKVNDLPIEDIPMKVEVKDDIVSAAQSKEPFNLQSYFKQETVDDCKMASECHNNYTEYYGNPESSSSGYNEPETSHNSEAVLDEEAIMKLCGTRGKRKREDIQILDVNQKEVLADAREWLLKGLMDDTTKRVSSSKKRGNEPTSQQRRKHQITYLAHQAKANEAELQNQWANNRQTKRQTQSKYGF